MSAPPEKRSAARAWFAAWPTAAFVLAALLAGRVGGAAAAERPELAIPAKDKVYVIPIRENIMPPLVYVVRRGVKDAMESGATALILDMKTDGGRVDVTEEIIEIVSKFKGTTVTYVNDRAFSAGAFISTATQKIYMAPQSVIGAAAPIMMAPGGGVAEKLPDTMEVKMTSAVRALVRVQAEKNGHNIEVVEAMIDKTKELKMDGEVLNKEGNILTLTDRQASKEYGDPPKKLLSSGTVESLDALLVELGYTAAQRVDIQPTGAEKLGTWINAIAPILLIIGMIGVYIEFKTPGFGLPGIIGIIAFTLYFFGGYVAGLSGAGWGVVFVLGLVLVAVELFLFPGTFIAGITGGVLMLVAIVMGMVDMYPGAPSWPAFPQLRIPLRDISVAIIVSLAVVVVMAGYFPKSSLYNKLVSQTASGEAFNTAEEERHTSQVGLNGVAISPLLPGGKARFGDRILDVITQGELIEKGSKVKIIGHSASVAVVEEHGGNEGSIPG